MISIQDSSIICRRNHCKVILRKLQQLAHVMSQIMGGLGFGFYVDLETQTMLSGLSCPLALTLVHTGSAQLLVKQSHSLLCRLRNTLTCGSRVPHSNPIHWKESCYLHTTVIDSSGIYPLTSVAIWPALFRRSTKP